MPESPAPLDHRASAPPPLPGVVLYAPGSSKSQVLRAFADELKARRWRVGGVILDTLYDAQGQKVGLDLVSLADERRIPLARPETVGIAMGRWMLDPTALAAGKQAIRAAVGAAELIIVDKFGALEGRGDGFNAALRQALAAAPALLVALRSEFLDAWDAVAGRPTVALRPDIGALWRWWGPYRLYEELARGVDDLPVRRVVIGMNWTLVESPHGCGLAHTPARDAPGCRPLGEAGGLAARSLKSLAALATAWNPFEAAIGLAAINAHYNRPELAGAGANGLDLFAALPGRKLVIGRFPELSRRVPDAWVIERAPAQGELPAHAADWVLPSADAVAVTASSLGNLTLPRLLELARGARVALIGPGTPLTPALHAYGIDVLSGFVVTDPERAARAVAEGGAVKALKTCGRLVTLVRHEGAATPGMVAGRPAGIAQRAAKEFQ